MRRILYSLGPPARPRAAVAERSRAGRPQPPSAGLLLAIAPSSLSPDEAARLPARALLGPFRLHRYALHRPGRHAAMVEAMPFTLR